MPLMPKRVKHRKMHSGSRSGNATSGTYVAFGDFGLQVLDRGWITNNQIEACRIAINRYPVSYTHLDVYKRQASPLSEHAR